MHHTPETGMIELHRQWVQLRKEHWAAIYRADELPKTDPRKAWLNQSAAEIDKVASRIAKEIMALPVRSQADLVVLLDLALVYDQDFTTEPKGEAGEYAGGAHALRFLREMQKLAPEIQFAAREDTLSPEQLRQLAA
jgi:hypothetical protein